MAENKAAVQQDLNEILKVRREKLAALQAAGKDPFQITKFDVTHHSAEIRESFLLQRSGSSGRHAVLCSPRCCWRGRIR